MGDNVLHYGLYTAPPKPAVPARSGLTGFLSDKTGVTGAWTLGVGLSAYLISKELYVFNAEVRLLPCSYTPLSLPLPPFPPSFFVLLTMLSIYPECVLANQIFPLHLPPPPPHTHTQTVTAVVVGGVIIWLVKKVGKPVAEYLDDRSQVRASYSYMWTVCGNVSHWLGYVIISMVTTLLQHTHQRILDGLNEGKNLNIRSLEEQIQAEKAVETYLEARHEAFEIIKVQHAVETC